MPTSLVSTGVQFPDSTTQTTAGVTPSGSATLTNKTISGANNTLTNISLSSSVTGTLPAANGGTGLTSPGTNGNVLTSNGSAWVSSAPSGGNVVLLSTVTAASSSTVDVETTFDSTYDRYVLVITKLQLASASGAPALLARLKIGGTYQTANYRWGMSYSTNDNSPNPIQVSGSSAGQGYMFVSPYYVSYSANQYYYGEINIYSPADTNNYKAILTTGFFGTDFSSAAYSFLGGGQYVGSTSAMTGIRFLTTTGDLISVGTFRLYGIKNS